MPGEAPEQFEPGVSRRPGDTDTDRRILIHQNV
jgi:hypothetical protein